MLIPFIPLLAYPDGGYPDAALLILIESSTELIVFQIYL